MKVCIGYRIQEGPWGGGNSFVSSLTAALRQVGHEVVPDLADGDVDIILMVDPRSRLPNVTIGASHILRYLAFRNPRAVVVHRINECDERKKTHTVNLRLRLANYCADHTVFIASWLRDLPVWRRLPTSSSVILNGAESAIFRPRGMPLWPGDGPLRLVTHHWGGNWMKGFDIYEILDRLLGDHSWRGRIDFTYIGSLPANWQFRNARYLPAMSGDMLAAELATHHVYVTGSINEPAGMHHIEGALCGLPILYRRSGALPEYCDPYGIGFEGAEDFVSALEQMMGEYPAHHDAVRHYTHTAERMCKAYLDLFEGLVARRQEISAARRLWRNPIWFALNQIPF